MTQTSEAELDPEWHKPRTVDGLNVNKLPPADGNQPVPQQPTSEAEAVKAWMISLGFERAFKDFDDWRHPDFTYLITNDQATFFYRTVKQAEAAIQAQIDEAVREARVDERKKWLANARPKRDFARGVYSHAELPISFYQDQVKLDQLTTQSKSKEAGNEHRTK